MRNGIVACIMPAIVILAGCTTTKVCVERPKPIRVDFQAIEVQSDALSLLGQKPRLDLDMVADLRKSGKARIASSQSITTLPGQEATIKGVNEIIYFTQLQYDSDKPTVNGISTIVGGVVEPSGAETRETGNILKVTPEWSDTGLITMTISMAVVGEPTWESYAPALSKETGKDVSAGLKQPIFHTVATTTSVSLSNGKTIILGICPKPNIDNVTLIFLIGATLTE